MFTRKATPAGASDDERVVASRIRAIMALRGRTMQELSAARGIPYRTVQSYLQGKIRPTARFIVAVAGWLDVSIELLLTGRAAYFDGDVLAKALADLERDQQARERATGTRPALPTLAGHFAKHYQNRYAIKYLAAPGTPALVYTRPVDFGGAGSEGGAK
jgi:transcriptional regulator with XRE-family HTH domain